jgi:hypothetical protein
MSANINREKGKCWEKHFLNIAKHNVMSQAISVCKLKSLSCLSICLSVCVDYPRMIFVKINQTCVM